jgi:hypothetical protein
LLVQEQGTPGAPLLVGPAPSIPEACLDYGEEEESAQIRWTPGRFGFLSRKVTSSGTDLSRNATASAAATSAHGSLLIGRKPRSELCWGCRPIAV